MKFFSKRRKRKNSAVVLSTALCLSMLLSNVATFSVSAETVSGNDVVQEITAPENEIVQEELIPESDEESKETDSENETVSEEAVSGNDAVPEESISGNDVLKNTEISGEDINLEEGTSETESVSGNDVIIEEMISTIEMPVVMSMARATGLTDAAELALAGKTSETMTIDGNLTEGIWNSVDGYYIEYLADFTISNNTSIFKTAWDVNKLYIGVEVNDAAVVTAENGVLSSNIYENDSVEIFIDSDNAKGKWDENDFHLFIQHDGKYDVWGGSSGAWGATDALNAMDCVVVMTDDGFNVEVAIPFDALGISPADGSVLGLNVINNDNDSYTGSARKEIIWNPGHGAGKPATWGALCLYEVRKPIVSTYGTPVVNGNDVKNWNPSIWNFSDDYSLAFANIPGATLKFASLSDYDGLYIGMLIEGAGDAVPFAEAVISGTNGRSGGRVEYDHIMQWQPLADELWQQLNVTAKLPTGVTKTITSSKYNLGNGSYAVVVKFPWDQLSVVEDPEHPRANYSVMSFSIETGNDGAVAEGTNTSWMTGFNAWWNPLNNVATLLINNSNIVESDPNVAPTGNALYAYSIPQGGSVSGKVNTTDANADDVLTFTLEEGYDASKYGEVTVNSATGEWKYTTPNANFVQADRTGVNFWIIATDEAGASFRTRIQVNVEHTPTNLTYYVDGDTGNDSNDGLTYATALKTIGAANDKVRPGDTVLVYESEVPYGWHTEEEYEADPNLYASVRNGAIALTTSGLPGYPVTYKAAEGQQPIIKANGVWQTVAITGNYITFEGFIVQGKNDELTYEGAYDAFWAKIAPKDGDEYSSNWNYPSGNYNTPGIAVEPLESAYAVGDGGVTDANACIPHHIIIRNCLVEDMPSSGIGGSECDYVTIENCTSINNGWYDMWGTSGLGFIKTVDIDDNTKDYKIIVRNNISAGNRHFIPWKAGTVRLSDGNGIIFDTMDDHEYDYQGKSLIANNLVYENGGSGIHTFRSDNIDMINNTVFNNGSTPELGWSEMFANDAENVNMYNNLVYSRTGNKEDIKSSTVANLKYDNNLFFNYYVGSNVGTAQTGVTVGGNNLYEVDPKFASVKSENKWAANMPEGFDTATDYPADWYTVKTADATISPNQWSKAANAKAAGWYPGADYDITTYGYDFTLAADSPAWGAADADWQAVAGGAECENVIGIFSEVGARLETPVEDEETVEPAIGIDSNLALSGKTTETMTVDGKFTEGIWKEVEAYNVSYLADATINNNVTVFKTTWDDANLYVGVEVTDADVVTADNGVLSETIYENDGVEIFIDGDRIFDDHKTNIGKDAWDKTDFHIFIQHDGKVIVWGGSKGAWSATTELDAMVSKVVLNDSGFNVEVAIPFEALGVTPADGSVLGLNVVNNDNDNYTSNARKEIIWVSGHAAGSPSTWGEVSLYETRKPLISTYGSPVVNGNKVENWDPSIWNFSDEYSLDFAEISGATVKFASLSDYEGFYLGMLIEGAEEADPFVEVILSGDNKRSGGIGDYDSVLQWYPTGDAAWKQLNAASGKKPTNAKYNLGNGSYAVVAKFTWDQLSAVEDPEFPRENFSVMSFAIATGVMTGYNPSNSMCNGSIKAGDNSHWLKPFSSWPYTATFDNSSVGTIIINNNDIRFIDPNVAPTGNALYAYSIPQGGSVSGKVNTTDANADDVLTFTLEEGYDASKYGEVTVNSATGEWTYTTPNANFVQADRTGVNFWIIATDEAGASFRTRIQINVEHTPTNLTYYVDGDTGNDSNDGLSYATALKTINAAHDKTKPGDTVLIYSSDVPYGYYTEEEYAADPNLYGTVRNGAIVITNSGLPEAPITYKAAEGERPVITANGTWSTMKIAANYINIEGLTVRGKTSEDMTYEEAYNAFWAKIAPKDGDEYNSDWNYPSGNYNTNGIGVGPVNDVADVTDANACVPHHVTISNCLIENMAASGVGGNQCDYVTIENCTSINNGWWEMYASSGIGFIKTIDIDDNTDDYKIIVRDNISAGNRHFIPWNAGTVRLSDGNGIIFDTMDDHEFDYQGKSLVANNLVYENGGSGIHTFRSDNIDMINNTVFNNGTTPEMGWSEMFANDAENVNMYNNIVYSRTGNKEDIKSSTVANVQYDYNIFYNYASGSNVGIAQTGITAGNHNQYGVDPMFTSVTSDNRYVANMPEGFDTATDYPEDWYTVKNADSSKIPNQWSKAANAKAAGWYPGVNYDATTFGYDFTLAANSPAWGAADDDWQAIAGGAEYDNVVGIFGKVGAELPEESDSDNPGTTNPDDSGTTTPGGSGNTGSGNSEANNPSNSGTSNTGTSNSGSSAKDAAIAVNGQNNPATGDTAFGSLVTSAIAILVLGFAVCMLVMIRKKQNM